jgi:hypothetical protein
VLSDLAVMSLWVAACEAPLVTWGGLRVMRRRSRQVCECGWRGPHEHRWAEPATAAERAYEPPDVFKMIVGVTVDDWYAADTPAKFAALLHRRDHPPRPGIGRTLSAAAWRKQLNRRLVAEPSYATVEIWDPASHKPRLIRAKLLP